MSLLVSNPEVVPPVKDKAKSGAQISFTLHPQPGETITGFCRRLVRQLEANDATPLHLLAFGDIRACVAAEAALRNNSGGMRWPLTWVEGAACDGTPLAGVQVHAFLGDVKYLEVNGRVAGSVFTHGGAQQCLVAGLTPADTTLSRAGQTRQALEDLQSVLAQAGFELADVVRTWFFLDDILSWYDDFNHTRTEIYSGVKFRTGSLPASTGVGARNPAETALNLATWALRPLDENSRAIEVGSPLQCPAPAYGSSFSRAVELPAGAGRHLLISGTASIAPGGATLWQNDVRRQVELTMEVVEAILRGRGFSFADLTRAVAYFKHPSDAGVFGEWSRARGLASLPVVAAHCAVCRDDLLFELEADAFSVRPVCGS